MTHAQVEKLLSDIKSLPEEKKRLVISYVQNLKGTSPLPPGTPGKSLLKFAGTLDAESAAEMEAAIEDGCEKVAKNEHID